MKDIIVALSGDSQDPNFKQAIHEASIEKESGQGDFLTLFGEALESIDPNIQLVFFFLYELRDKGITINSDNSEIMQALRDEVIAEVRCRVDLFFETNRAEFGQVTYSFDSIISEEYNVDSIHLRVEKRLTPSQIERLKEFVQTSKIQNRDGINMAGKSQYVDLGLPSGTLWATCNIGANNPEDYGDYYAWGETVTKTTYDWNNYKYANGSHAALTKYCSKDDSDMYGDNGFADNLTTLQADDDPAMVSWGSDWRIPSRAQWEELIQNTTCRNTTLNGVRGMLFTSSKGQIFLPATHRDTGFLYDGLYWSRSLADNNHSSSAWAFGFAFDVLIYDRCEMLIYDRCRGFAVRPVREK